MADGTKRKRGVPIPENADDGSIVDSTASIAVGDDSSIAGPIYTVGGEPAGSIDPASGNLGSIEPSVSTGKRRGRKPGSKNKTTKAPISVSGIEMMLFSLHQLLASATKTPELVLEKEEANTLAAAVTAVAEYYNVLSSVSGQAIAWVNLAQVVGVIYGTRIYAIKMRKAAEKPARPAATVHPMFHTPGVQ